MSVFGQLRWLLTAAIAAAFLTTACSGGLPDLELEPTTAATSTPSDPTVIYVQDRTGPEWPVRAAVSTWRAGLRTVDLRYGACRAGADCIEVTTRELATDRIGETGWFGGNVTLNSLYAHHPAAERTHAVLHELGHALGLSHTDDPHRLMYETVTGSVTRPAGADYAAVNRRYR